MISGNSGCGRWRQVLTYVFVVVDDAKFPTAHFSNNHLAPLLSPFLSDVYKSTEFCYNSSEPDKHSFSLSEAIKAEIFRNYR